MQPSLKATYDENGYVIVPSLISPSEREHLEQACSGVISRTRSGSWPYRRTVGSQFPPYDENFPDSWGVQHVMHPDLAEPIFAQWYTSDNLIRAITELLDCSEDALQMELFNLLINPLEHNFALCWHRDDIKPTATKAEEEASLGIWHHGVQWNTALFEDACLFIVPKSHKLPRTPEQRLHSSTMQPPDDPLQMPSSICVILQPGDTVFYNSNILHCATYDAKKRRATLHASMGDIAGGPSRSRNVLQHGLQWMREDKFRESLNVRGRRMLEHLIAMADGVVGEVQYSL